jgi:DNA adenine methylase
MAPVTPESSLPRSRPLVPWIGGKRRLARHILPLFPDHQCYVEPCAGAAALFFLKEPSPVEVLNDVNGDLITLYRVVQHHPEEFLRQFRWALSSRQLFTWLKATPAETLTDIQRAARFFYLQRACFGGKVAGQTFGTSATTPPKLNILRIEEDLSAAHLRLAGATIEHLDWADCVQRYDRPGTLFYVDPPYWGTEGYGVPFGLETYERMAEFARTIAGKMVISVNDIPEMRRAFKGLRMERLELRYSVGGAGRGREPRGELIIRSW